MVSVREIPRGSGINGRPVLDDGCQHLAYHVDDPEIWGRTWCGREIPAAHLCPSRSEVESRPPWVITNCTECHEVYRVEHT